MPLKIFHITLVCESLWIHYLCCFHSYRLKFDTFLKVNCYWIMHVNCMRVPCVAITTWLLHDWLFYAWLFHTWHMVNYTRHVCSTPRENMIHANMWWECIVDFSWHYTWTHKEKWSYNWVVPYLQSVITVYYNSRLWLQRIAITKMLTLFCSLPYV